MKRTVSILISLALLLTILPVAALAAGPRVYCYAPESWEKCYVYAWNESGGYASWPGEDAVKSEWGFWYYDMPEGYENLIFHDDRSMDNRTEDLKLSDANGDYRYLFEQQRWAGEIEHTYTVVGNADFMGNWDVDSTVGDMWEMHDGVYQWHIPYLQPGNYEFKVVRDHDWSHSWGTNGNNYILSVDYDAVVTIYFDSVDQAIRVVVEGYPFAEYTVVGNADFMGDWDASSTLGDMEKNSNGLFEKTFYDVQPGEYELIVVPDHDDGRFWGVGNENFRFTVTEPCEVLVTFEEWNGVIRVYLDGEEYLAFTEKTIHLHVSDSWASVYAYTEEPETMGQWPGTELVKDGNWYTFTVSVDEDYVYFHDNVKYGEEMGIGTLVHWPEIWMTIDRFGIHFSQTPPELPEEPLVSPHTYTVVGNADFMGNWDVNSTLGDMVKNGEVLFEKTFYNVQPGEYEFKVVCDHSWDYACGSEDGSNYAVTVDRPVGMVIYFESVTGRIFVETFDYEEPEECQYKVVGDGDFMGAWDVTCDLGVMTKKESSYYEVTFLNVEPGEYNFLVVMGDNWDHCWGTPETNGPIRFDVKELTNITIRFGTFEGEFGICVDYTYNRLGDFDGDGSTDNIGGVARLFSHVRGKTVLAEELQPKADTNQDGKINIADVARLFKAVRTGEELPTIPVN